MRDPEQFYDSLKELKEDHPTIAYKIREFISGQPDHWSFKECFNPDCDGSRFEIALKDLYGNERHITAVRGGDSYIFTEN